MAIPLPLPGALIAATGFVIVFSLLASSGALAKSKQLGALAHLASGGGGALRRALLFTAFAMMLVGSCGAFAGVASSDRERARACTAECTRRGHTSGRIGPSRASDPKNAKRALFVACVCAGGRDEPLELRASELVR